jgi:hypothetical protein
MLGINRKASGGQRGMNFIEKNEKNQQKHASLATKQYKDNIANDAC